MATRQQQIMNNYVVNPKTGRLVKIHSGTYKKLVSSKILKTKYITKKTIYVGENAKEVKQNFVNNEPNTILCATNTQISQRSRHILDSELIDNCIMHALDVIKNNINDIPDDTTDDELNAIIKNLINQKMVDQ